MPSDWEATTLGNEAEVLTGYPFKSARYTEDPSGVRLLRGDNVVQGALRWNGVRRWPTDELDELERYALGPGDVVVAMDRPWIEAGLKYARVGPHDLPAYLVQRVARLRAKQRLSQEFLFWLVGSSAFSQYVQAIQTGTAVPHISSKQIADFTFLLPSLAEQASITGILSLVQEKIEANRRLVARLEQLADLHFRRTARDIPERVPLAAVAKVDKTVVQPRETPDRVFEHFSIPAFDAGREPVVQPGAELLSGKTVIKGQELILLSKLNPERKRVWWPRPDGLGEAVCSSEFLVLRPTDTTTSAFLYCSLRADDQLYNEIVSHSTGTTGSRQRVRPADVLRCGILAPSPEQLAAFERTVAPLFDLGISLAREARRLARYRDLLAPSLVTGRTRLRGARKDMSQAPSVTAR